MEKGRFLTSTSLIIVGVYFVINRFATPIPDLVAIPILLIALLLFAIGELKKRGLIR